MEVLMENYRNSFNGITYQRLRKKIKKQYDIDMPPWAVRQYGGHWMKAHGQWSWFTIESEDHPRAFGSQSSVRDLITSYCLEVSLNRYRQYDIDPCVTHNKDDEKCKEVL